MNIHIRSIKSLYIPRDSADLPANEGNSPALPCPVGVILCTMNPPRTEGLRGIPSLFLRFADTELRNHPDRFTEDMAFKVKNFLDSVLPEAGVTGALTEAGDLYFCCDSGESRSAALAAAVCRYLGMDEWVIWNDPHYHPNLLVYEIQCRVMGCPAAPEELESRRQASEEALARRIRKAREHPAF